MKCQVCNMPEFDGEYIEFNVEKNKDVYKCYKCNGLNYFDPFDSVEDEEE